MHAGKSFHPPLGQIESDRSENWHILRSDWFATVKRSKPIRMGQML